MGKTGRWIKSLLSGKKEKNNNTISSSTNHENEESITITVRPTTPISTTSKEKKRWSFRRSSVTPPLHKDFTPTSDVITTTPPPPTNSEDDHKKLHAMAVAAAAAAARAAAAAIQLAAAVKIQAAFRGYLARKALNALKGLVKLQALVRGHLVRKQAAATLRCMQALVTVQARARAQRLRMSEDPRQSVHRKCMQDNKSRNPYQEYEEDIKIVEMDTGESRGSRNSYSNQVQKEERFEYTKQHISPAPSAITDQSPRACSGHFEEYSAQNSPQCYTKPEMPFAYARSEYAESLYNEYAFYPSYMANTQSSKAKVRSHSAPKQRPESLEKQPSRRRPSIEGRNVPRAVRMQRSSSHIGSTAQNYQYPWSIKLDRSNISIKDSECGSNCSVLTTHTNYCTSLVGFHVQGNRY